MRKERDHKETYSNFQSFNKSNHLECYQKAEKCESCQNRACSFVVNFGHHKKEQTRPGKEEIKLELQTNRVCFEEIVKISQKESDKIYEINYISTSIMIIKSKQPSQKSFDTNIKPSSSAFPEKELSYYQKSKFNHDEDTDILTRACCPNCRYTFRVVNEKKLSHLKKKIEERYQVQDDIRPNFNPQLKCIESPSPSLHRSQIGENEKAKNPEKNDNILWTEYDKSKKSKKSSTNEIGIQINILKTASISHKNLKPKSKSPMRIQTSHLETPKLNVPNIKNISKVDHCKTPTKGPKREPISKTPTLMLKTDVDMMKQFLKEVHREKSENISIRDSMLFSDLENMNCNETDRSSGKAEKTDRINHLEIEIPQDRSLRQIDIQRKCRDCEKIPIELELALKAIYSERMEEEIHELCSFMKESCEVPSYLKLLKLEHCKN